MIRTFYIFCFLFLLCPNSDGQENLVLNPSFEDTASMTYGYPFRITSDWWSPNAFDSDYFTPFCEELCCGSGFHHCSGVVDFLGYQQAQDSSSYIGLVIYESTGDTKDYAQGFLSQPLIAGVNYCVGIWIALADSSSFISCDFQVAFTNGLVHDGQASNLLLSNYLAMDISGINSEDWTYFEGIYTALGGEQFIYLGSNTPNESISCIQILPPTWLNNACYVLVDNISVRQSNLCAVGLTGSILTNSMQIYPNPVIDYFEIKGLIDPGVVRVYDQSGRLLKEQSIPMDKPHFNMSDLESGVYLIEFHSLKTEYVKRIIKL